MNNQVLIFLACLFTLIILGEIYVDTFNNQKYYLYPSSKIWTDFYKWNIILPLGLAFILSFLPKKVPFVFRFLFVLVIFPLFYLIGRFNQYETFLNLDLLLGTNQKVKKINYQQEKVWRIYQIITEKSDTIYLSQHPNLTDQVSISEIKNIRIKRSITSPDKFHYYFVD